MATGVNARDALSIVGGGVAVSAPRTDTPPTSQAAGGRLRFLALRPNYTQPEEAKTLWEILDMYIVQWIVSLAFIIGAGMMIGTYNNRLGADPAKAHQSWYDLYHFLAFFAIGMAIVFMVVTLGAWIFTYTPVFSRDTRGYFWLHAASIATAFLTTVWGGYALVLSIGALTEGINANPTEIYGWFIVMICVIYSVILVVRSASGATNSAATKAVMSAEQQALEAAAKARASTARPTFDAGQVLTGLSRPTAGAAAPLFSGAGSFGGIDLSDVQPSGSMTALPAGISSGGVVPMPATYQGGGACGMPTGAPVMVFTGGCMPGGCTQAPAPIHVA